MTTPRGSQGSWFATWRGHPLPCVHRHWAKPWPNYDDPNVDGRRQWDEFIEALRNGKKALLTTSHIPADGSGEGWRRASYVSIWTIDNLSVEGTHLKFTFGDRLHLF